MRIKIRSKGEHAVDGTNDKDRSELVSFGAMQRADANGILSR
jgi:hypothetical protein